MRVAPMNSRFLEACRRRPTDVRPVWFMRQAGRYMKQYRDIRAKHGILELCKRPDLAAQITLQPVEILDVDAAIVFADLLLPVEPMGLKLRFATGEGPIIDNPVRTSSDIDSLSISNTDDLGYVGETIQLVTKALAGTRPGDRLRRRAVHHGQLYGRGRSFPQFRPHQADDVPRRDLVAPADGQAGGRAGRFRSLAGGRGRAHHSGFRQLGRALWAPTIMCASWRRIRAR